MYAMNLARYQRYPDCKQKGLRALPPLAIFASKEVGKREVQPQAPDSNHEAAQSETLQSFLLPLSTSLSRCVSLQSGSPCTHCLFAFQVGEGRGFRVWSLPIASVLPGSI